MNSIDFKLVTKYSKVRYTSPSSELRKKGNIYLVDSVSGNFIYHSDDMGRIIEGHKDQYELIHERKTMKPDKLPELPEPTTLPELTIPEGPRDQAVNEQLEVFTKD